MNTEHTGRLFTLGIVAACLIAIAILSLTGCQRTTDTSTSGNYDVCVQQRTYINEHIVGNDHDHAIQYAKTECENER